MCDNKFNSIWIENHLPNNPKRIFIGKVITENTLFQLPLTQTRTALFIANFRSKQNSDTPARNGIACRIRNDLYIQMIRTYKTFRDGQHPMFYAFVPKYSSHHLFNFFNVPCQFLREFNSQAITFDGEGFAGKQPTENICLVGVPMLIPELNIPRGHLKMNPFIPEFLFITGACDPDVVINLKKFLHTFFIVFY